MATSESFGEKTSVVRIDIDEEKYRLELSHSSSAAELRTILTERYDISSDTRFLDSEGYTLFPKDEQSITIDRLLTKDNIVKLKKPPPIPIPERKTKSSEKKVDLKYAQTLSQSTRTSFREVKLPETTPTSTDNKVILATDLDIDMWEKIFRNCNLLNGIRMDEETPRRAFRSIFQFRKSDDNFPLFQITDDSYIRVYMKDKEIHSSFLSSQFFDGGIEFSSPWIGIGINAEYSKTKTRTNTQRNTYLTYCFNFPRVPLQLDSSYLEPTSHFIEAIDNVLAILKRDEQIIQLEKVLSTYGHVYPSLIVLGGHLYHKEVHRSKEKAEEAKRRLSGDVSFSASIVQPAKIHGGGGSEKQSEEKSSEQTSLLTFEAVGGDTRGGTLTLL